MDAPSLPKTAPAVLEALCGAVGADCITTGAGMAETHFGDYVVRQAEGERPLAVVLPRSTADVSAILRVCHAHGVAVVPQGGLTGLAGGATPVDGCVVLSLARMRAIEEVDAAAATMTVEAGVPLQSIQEAADAAGMLFALDIGSRGSCLIGGNVSTNAGGNRVLRYGMARDLVLGIEVVLADGTVMTSLNKMLKNNAGYDLKQLFIGAEGTLGVITRLVLRLYPRPESVCTAVVALEDYDAVLELLARARRRLGGTLAAFEVMWPEFYELVTTAHGCRPPVPRGSGLYVLMEALGTDQQRDAEQFQAMIEAALEDGVVEDAAIAQSLRESREMWELRDSVIQFRQSFHPHVGFDVSVPVARMQDFVTDCATHLYLAEADARVLWFGHVADSNLHISYKLKSGGIDKKRVDEIVYARVRAFGGSVSAEHGIGLLKKAYLPHSRTPVEIDVMRRVKAALDPSGILNPGKIF
jgi:FAD/FMN-containing dehydrogenase